MAKTPPHECRGVVLHHTVMSYEETIAHMLNPASQVSYHCVIAPNGERTRLVADQYIAWHAGISEFRGRTGCNAFLLGLAFAGDTYREPIAAEQIASALEWLEARWKKYHWTAADITDHRQIAVGRKDDLNPAEWERAYGSIVRHFSAQEIR